MANILYPYNPYTSLQSRFSMYIRGLILREFAVLAEVVPIAGIKLL